MRVVGEVFGTAVIALGVTLSALGLLFGGEDLPCAPSFLWLDGKEGEVKDWLYYAHDSVVYSSLIVIGRLLCYLLAKVLLPFSVDVPSTADNLYSIGFHSYLAYLAAQASFDLCDTVGKRWQGQTSHSHTYLLLFVLDNTLHMPLQVAKDVTTIKNLTVLAHHILSNLCYVIALYTGALHFWACLAGVSEITNPPLSLAFTLKEVGAEHGLLKQLHRLALLAVCLLFVAFRIVLFPSWLYLFARDNYHHAGVVTCSSTVFQRSIYTCVILILLGLSCQWLLPLLTLLRQALRGSAAAESEAMAPRGASTRARKAGAEPSIKSTRRRAGREVIVTERRGRFSRAQGASSGAETWVIASVLMAVLMFLGSRHGWRGGLLVPAALALLQLVVMSPICRNMLLVYCFSMKLGPAVMRNAVLGFAQCVRPGGRPTSTHCLDMYHYPAALTALVWLIAALILLPLGPLTSLIRLFYPEHSYGVNSGRFLRLYWLFLRHPLAVQGEGPSNGDGLSSMCSSESLIYPITHHSLATGPPDTDYWLLPPSAGGEGKPRLRDMFHDKIFCHRFFRSHGVAHPTLVGYVEHHVLQPPPFELRVTRRSAPKKLIWKPRYSTMGLGVEHFDGWQPDAATGEWAPSSDPYLIEEFIQSTEYDHSEWYRCTTLWAHDESEPKTGYIWRMRNPNGDKRVQTDIMGGQYCVTSAFTPFIGPTAGGTTFDPRSGETLPLDPRVHSALTTAIAQMVRMHTSLGQELYSIGWDVMVVGTVPVFVEFNIGNGFYVADHTIEECEQMADFFQREFHARLRAQLLDFDASAAQAARVRHRAATSGVPSAKQAPLRRSRSRSPVAAKWPQ